MSHFFKASIVLILVNLALSLNILVITTWPGRSHYIAFAKVHIKLAEKGHNVTVLSYYPESKQTNNYENVEIEGLEVFAKSMEAWSMFENIKNDRLTMYLTPTIVGLAGNFACELLLESKNVKELLKKKNKYDVMLVEDFYTECTWPLIQKVNCPVIKTVSHPLTPWIAKRLGNPFGSAYVPNTHLPLNNEMSFIDRVENSVVNVFHLLTFDYFLVPNQKHIAAKLINADDTSFNNRIYNTSLVLINTHFTVNGQMPLVPNIIEIGGAHIGEPNKLPEVSTCID